MDQTQPKYEVAIIGGGPIGIELAAALRHAKVSYVHFEAGAIGSTLLWWAPGTRFFSSPERIEIAGVPLALPHQDKASREEYLAYLRGVVRQFDLTIHSYTRVMEIHRADDEFELITQPSAHGVGGPEEIATSARAMPQAAAQTRWRARNVVLAIGDMHRPRMLGVPGEDLPHVSHYFGEPHWYFGRRVLIAGGKNSAVEAALRLHRIGVDLAMSYRGSEFDPKRVKYWLRPELEWLISKGKIEFHPRTVVTRIEPHQVELASVDDPNQRQRIAANSVLLLTGYVQDSSLFERLGIELVGEERAPRFDLHTMQTNVPGVFVAGTAAGGSQRRARLFIENSHVHVQRIVRTIAGVDVPWPTGERDFGALEQ